MTPPRLQCLNASRNIAKTLPIARATFSTSQVRSAQDERPRQSSADILASLGGALDSSQSPPPTRDPPSSFKLPFRSNPRTLPRGATPPAAGKIIPGVQRLIAQSQKKEQARLAERRSGQLSQSSADQLANDKLGTDLSRQITRRWKQGDVYAPHDLSEVEMAKWKKRGRPVHDAFDVLDFNPKDSYRNFSIMSEYMTPMGRIKHSKETGLRPVNQRRIARAIRRSIGMGLMPSVYEHPELLHKRIQRNEQMSPLMKGPM